MEDEDCINDFELDEVEDPIEDSWFWSDWELTD